MPRLGTTSQKILLLLLGGVVLGFAGTPTQYGRILKAIGREWQEINRAELYRSIKRLYESKLVAYRERPDGTVWIELNRNGKKLALQYKLDEMAIPKPAQWDKKWRVVIFDVPERQKTLRDALRGKFKQLGLAKLQKSVFVHPYDCLDEIYFVIEVFGARRYVRFIEATSIDNELHLKKRFRLL